MTIETRPGCFAAVEKPTTNAERMELHLANFVHVTGLPGVYTPSRNTWGTIRTLPHPYTTILVTLGGEVWISARLPGESDRNYSHVVRILVPNGTQHMLISPPLHFRPTDLDGQHILRRLSNPDYDPADPSS